MKKIAFISILLLCLFVIQNQIRSIYDLWQKQDLVVSRQKELQKVKEEYARLKKQEARVKDPQFLEEEARNKLFLVKKDEQIVLVPTSVVSSKTAQKQAEKKANVPVYEQWLRFFISGKL